MPSQDEAAPRGQAPGDPVAVIGSAGLFPDARSAGELHELLAAGRDTMRRPAGRRLRAHGQPGTAEDYLAMGYLDRIDLFDHAFFGISRREAELMDPHQRLILQLAHEAVENACYRPSALRGSRTAVMVGYARSDYGELLDDDDPRQLLGLSGAAVAARISYVLGFTGPALVIDTACSSSLAAVAQAMAALRAGDADLALAGGVSVRPVLLRQEGHLPIRGVESADGRCRPFDEKATGATAGEGGGIVVLKLLHRAVADGDGIQAVLRGIAVNHNGGRIASMSAPSQAAQTEVITAAWADGGTEAATVRYVECHGSATPLGDVVEVDALRQAFAGAGVHAPHCAIGSVKGNIGHLDNAAGIAGLLKVMMSLRRGTLYPTANFSSPSPLIDFSGPVQVSQETRPWPAAGGAPRRAGLSSFGLTGTNVHAVVEEPPAPAALGQPAPGQPGRGRPAWGGALSPPGTELVTVSAKSASALVRYTAELADFAEQSGADLAAIAHAMNRGRDDYAHRIAVTAGSGPELAAALRAAAIPEAPAPADPPVVMLFSGDGGADAATWAELRAAYPGPGGTGHCPGTVPEPAGAAARLVAVQYALYQLARSLGIPDTHLAGSGAGNVTVRIARGELSLGEGLEAAAGMEITSEADAARLRRAMSGFAADGAVLAEMGAGGVLCREARRLAPELGCVALAASPDGRGLLGRLAELYRLGVRLDWDRYYEGRAIARIEAPTYPFDPVRCWPLPEGGTAPGPGRRRPAVPEPARAAPVPAAAAADRVARVWEEVLGTGGLGPDAQYFELGGTSIAGISVLRTLERDFGVALTFADLYAYPTVREFAGRLAELAGAAAPGEAAARRAIEPVPRGGPLPLSFGQEQLWYLDQLSPASPLYNIPHDLRLAGPLDLAALTAAVRGLIARHEVLRTCLPSDDGVPYTAIRPAEPELPVTDLSGLPEAARHAAARRIVDAAAVRPFDLATGPLVRTCLVRLADDDHILLWTYHHSVFDGWSPTVFFRDFTELYRARLDGREPDLPELTVQYADYAAWQREQLSGPGLERSLEFWRAELAGLERPELPLDRPRPPARTFEGDLIEFTIDAGLASRARQFSQRSGVTTFVTMLALVDALLYRWAGLTDVVVGVGTSGRVNPATHDLIGYFNNLPPFRTRVDGEVSFAGLVRRCAVTVAGVLDHEETPFGKIVAAVAGRREPGRHPLFDVAYTYQNVPQDTAELGGLTCSGYREAAFAGIAPGTAKFDLTVGVIDQASGPMNGYLEYAAALFDASTIRRLTGWLPVLLADAMRDPDQPVGGLAAPGDHGPAAAAPPALALRAPAAARAPAVPAGTARAVTGGADADAAVPVELFEEWARRRPEHPAICEADGTTVTYRELNRAANRLARRLMAAGAGPEVPVPVIAERGAGLAAGWLAVAKAGGAYVPIDPAVPRARADELIAGVTAGGPGGSSRRAGAASRTVSSGARTVVLAGPDLAAALAAPGGAADDDNPPRRVTPGSLAYICHTSGSTGRPQGCEIELGSLARLLDWYAGAVGITADDRVLQCVAPGFDVATMDVWVALSRGATLCILPAALAEPAALFRSMARRQVTVAFLPTPLAEVMLTDGCWPADLMLRVMITGGDRLRVRPPRGAPFRLLNAYGPTECTVVASGGYIGPAPGTLPDIGAPVAGTEIYLLDARRGRVPAGQWGELYIGGAAVGRGYHRNPALTAARFVADPFAGRPGARMYRTGDLARWRPDGTLDFGGRLDDQLEIRGSRVEPAEVERTLAAQPGVREALVVGAAAPGGSTRLVAHVAGNVPDPARLIARTAELLPPHMVPAEVVVHDSLPKTSNGKLDRRSLQTMSPPPVPPPAGGGSLTRAEQVLTRICSDLLAAGPVSPSDNFFELGGDSVLSVRVAARAARQGVSFTPQQFLQCQTIGELARMAVSGCPDGPVVDDAVAEDAAPGGAEPAARLPGVAWAPRQGTAAEAPGSGAAAASGGSAAVTVMPAAAPRRPAAVPPGTPIPLTPIMHSFLARLPDCAADFADVHTLETAPGVDASAARSAVELLISMHEPLRYRLRRSDLGSYLECAGTELAGLFDAKTLPPLSPQEEREVIAEDCAAMKAGMDPGRGGMLRARFYDRGRSRGGLIVLLVNHFVFDNMSIVVVLDDLDALLADLLAGRPPAALPRPPQWREWSQHLRDMSVSQELAAELTFWTAVMRAGGAAGPVTGAGGGGLAQRTVESAGVAAMLNASAAEAREAATCAAAVGLARWRGTASAYLMTEGESLPSPYRLAGRGPSVGWFTSVHPLLLEARPGTGVRDCLPAAVDRIRSVPGDGVGYGILRHLSPDSPAVARLRALPEPDVMVLHGLSDTAALDSGVRLMQTRWDLAPNLKRASGAWYPVIVATAVRDGALRVSVSSSETLAQAQVDALADEIARACAELGQ